MSSDLTPLRRATVIRGGIRFLALLLLLLASCSKLLGLRDGTVQGACTTDAECAPGYGCLQDLGCHNRCTEDNDCGRGARCFKAFTTTACIPASEGCGQPPIGSNAVDACPDGSRCDGAVCRTRCTASTDCAGGQECVNGGCVSDSSHETPLGDGVSGAGGSGFGGSAGAGNVAGTSAGGASDGGASDGGANTSTGGVSEGGGPAAGGAPAGGAPAGGAPAGGAPAGGAPAGGAPAGGAPAGGAPAGGAPAGGAPAGGAPAGGAGVGGSAGSPPTGQPSSGCAAKTPRPAGGQVQVLNTSLYLFPESYDGTKPFPLLIALHACGNPNTQFVVPTNNTGFATEYVRAFPNTPDSGQCWTSYTSDIARITAQYDELMSKYCIDQSRVFAIAHSAGAQLLVNILAHLADAQHLKLKGVSPVAGDPFPVAVPVPVLYIDGIMDSQRAVDSAQSTLAKFRVANSCASTSKPYTAVVACNSVDAGQPPVNPGCIAYDGCSVPTIWCSHNDPNYSGTQHGVPCFGIKAMYDFFHSL